MRKSILDVLLERSTTSLFLDGGGRIVETSGSPETLGIHNSDILGRHLSELLEPAYRGSVDDIIERCLLHGRQEAVALRFTSGKEMRQLLFTPRDLTALDWPEAAALRIQDLTSALRTHDISLLSHELFNAVLNDIGEGILVLDPNLKITHINDFASRLLNLDKGQLVGSFTEQLPPRLMEIAPEEETIRLFEEGMESNKLAHLPGPEGGDLSLLVNYYPVKDASGRISHLLVTLQDMTEEQETARKIQRINRRLQEKVRELSVLNKLSSDFNTCSDCEELYPRITTTIVCGLGFHDTVAVLALSEEDGLEPMLRSYFGIDREYAELLKSKPSGLSDNKVIGEEAAAKVELLRRLQLNNAIYSPVVREGVLVGYLNVFHRPAEPIIEEEATLLRIITENLGHFLQRVRAERRLRQKVLTLTVLKQISDALQKSKELEQIAYVFLTGVTAEQGLGFNRAVFLLIDGDRETLAGRLAIGPMNAAEAARIWNELRLEEIDFGRLLTDFMKIELLRNSELNRLISGRSLKIGDSDLCRIAFQEPSSRRLGIGEIKTKDDRELLVAAGFERFAVAPLFAAESPIGLLIVDKKFTGDEISVEDLRFLDLVANQAQASLESNLLYRELQSKVESLKLSNMLLQEHRSRLANLERLSAVGEMAASVAHEIRNPLVSIGGFARSLYDECSPDDANRKFLKIIRDEVERLEGVVTNLLTYAKPIKPHFRYTLIRDVIQEVIAMVEPEFSDAGIKIVTRMDRKTVETWIDPDLIKQALLNIFNNSSHAMPSGGMLHISTKVREDEIQIGIRDSGPGISRENLKRIFEPFFTTRPAGIGLGLAIVQNIVKSHGGKIKVGSWLGRGTTFQIRLPIIEQLDS
jgi:signal transduction histidine kinase/PAS domain-containing protein